MVAMLVRRPRRSMVLVMAGVVGIPFSRRGAEARRGLVGMAEGCGA